jgi:hypothetical protein
MLYYRAHRADQPFDVEHASTAPICIPEGTVAERFRAPKPGYSAFWNPHHVQEYLDQMHWDPEVEGRSVLAFQGTPIGEGHDGEPRVIPTSDQPDFIMSWEDFTDALEITSNGYGRWDEHTWGDGPDGQLADDGYISLH